MPRESGLPQTTVRVRLQVIERCYGRDNLDNAGDDLVHCLAIVSHSPNQYQWSFEYDSSHPNCYYHTLNFVVRGMDEETADNLKNQIRNIGLLE